MGLAALGIALAVATDVIEYWMLVAASVVQGSGMSMLGPSRLAMTADLVERDALTNAIFLSNASVQTTRVFGPVLAGMLIAVEPIGIGGVYFLGAGLALLSVISAVGASARQPPRVVRPYAVRRHGRRRRLRPEATGTDAAADHRRARRHVRLPPRHVPARHDPGHLRARCVGPRRAHRIRGDRCGEQLALPGQRRPEAPDVRSSSRPGWPSPSPSRSSPRRPNYWGWCRRHDRGRRIVVGLPGHEQLPGAGDRRCRIPRPRPEPSHAGLLRLRPDGSAHGSPRRRATESARPWC